MSLESFCALSMGCAMVIALASVMSASARNIQSHVLPGNKVSRIYHLLLIPSIKWILIHIYHPPHQGVHWTL